MSIRIAAIEDLGQKRRANRIVFEGGPDIVTSRSVVSALDLREGDQVDIDKLRDLVPDDGSVELSCPEEEDADISLIETVIDIVARQQCKRRAYSLVANRDYSVFEVTQRLRWDGYREVHVQEIIEHLVSLDLLNDQRYAARLCEMRLEAGWGPYVIERKLSQSGIDDETIRKAIDRALHEDEFDLDGRAAQLVAKFDKEDPRQRQRAMRRLVTRGYDYDCVKRVTS